MSGYLLEILVLLYANSYSQIEEDHEWCPVKKRDVSTSKKLGLFCRVRKHIRTGS